MTHTFVISCVPLIDCIPVYCIMITGHRPSWTLSPVHLFTSPSYHMSGFTSISTNGTHYLIKLLEDGGKNFQTWVMQMELILQTSNVWDVVDPSPSGTPMLTTPGQQLDNWSKNDKKVLIQIKCLISNTAILSLKGKTHAWEAWITLSECYNGIRAQDATIISSKLHQFMMDDSKPLESQINTMCEYWYQLESFSNPITDSKFAMILSESLPLPMRPLNGHCCFCLWCFETHHWHTHHTNPPRREVQAAPE